MRGCRKAGSHTKAASRHAKQRRRYALQPEVLLQRVGSFAAMEEVAEVTLGRLQHVPDLHLQARQILPARELERRTREILVYGPPVDD